MLLQAGLPVLVVAVVLATTLIVLAARGGSSDKIAIGDRPELVDAQGALSFGAKDPKVVIQVVEDFQCPICRQFEATSGPLLAQYRADPRIQVQYRPIAFLDRVSTTRYSSRASNAAACVAAEGGEKWLAFHQEALRPPAARGRRRADRRRVCSTSPRRPGRTGDGSPTASPTSPTPTG
ncbi:thioredoxin domain-containing protein [Nocardioides sp. W3-2-3]|uniref:DsbA family protein n=1 Tax=Nocardioides convexus TaxID=2712224 RepID=UPI00241843CE|nr:thioredoxin domain-containing protein [Nocardioides convexus]NHA01098.1 thioredoxin domain-containing protein [Nocardioides convexus]